MFLGGGAESADMSFQRLWQLGLRALKNSSPLFPFCGMFKRFSRSSKFSILGGLSLLFDEEVEKVEVEDGEGEGREGRKKAQSGNGTCRGRNVTARPADQIVLIALKAMVAILTSDQGI